MIAELIEKTDINSIVWVKLYSKVFTLRVVYRNRLYILFSTSGEAHLKVYTFEGVLLETLSNTDIRSLYTTAKKQFFGTHHNKTYKRK